MDFAQEQQFVADIKRYVSENLSLSQINDDELEEKIEEIVLSRIGDMYCSIEQRVCNTADTVHTVGRKKE